MKNPMLASLLIALAFAGICRAEDAAAPAPDKATLEKQLAEKLSHSRFIGHYSIEGQEGPPKQDEYTLGEVSKSEGDKWLFHASLQFGAKVVTIPLEIPIIWAGDTPIISVTNFGIPGMGSYTARVLISGDHYAGTWSSANHAGYLWGRIEKIPATQPVPEGKQGRTSGQ
jgi:hypothetical protein